MTSYIDHEELLRLATPTELRRIFELVSYGKLNGLPIIDHS